MKSRRLKAFTLIELLIVISLIGILSVVAFIGTQRARVGAFNEKVNADLLVISQALESYKQDNEGRYPIPLVGQSSHVRCFNGDTSYAHDCDTANFRQSMIDNSLISKRYLLEVPTDPRTNTRYSYAVTGDGEYFQVAGILQDKEGYFSSRVEGNLAEGYRLPSIIRSYNKPGFVVDGGQELPYNPDHLTISANLVGATGVMVINEAGQPKEITDTLYVGDTIVVEEGGSVSVFFSDGSVMAMGDEDNVTELQILPQTIVEKNDETGILTKIRLKLFSGKIWNKVVRLSEGSEFTIETTNAIAGVRGTEFGLDAGSGSPETPATLIVLAGSVWVEEDIDEWLVEANTESGPMQALVTPEGPDNLQSTDPLPDWAVKLSQLGTGLSAGVIPYLVGGVVSPGEPYEVFLSFNNITTKDAFSFDGLEVFGESQLGGARLIPADLEPLMEIDSAVITYDPVRQLYVFPLDYSPDQSNPLWLGQEERQDLIAVRAYLEFQNGDRLYSNLSWPPKGFQENPVEETEEWFVMDSGVHPELAFNLPTPPQATNTSPGLILDIDTPSPLETACNNANGIFNSTDESCWVLGDAGDSCTATCEALVPGESLCEESDWNDDDQCTICKTLVGDIGALCADSDNDYSPFYRESLNTCYHRINVSLNCTTSYVNRERVCKCT